MDRRTDVQGGEYLRSLQGALKQYIEKIDIKISVTGFKLKCTVLILKTLVFPKHGLLTITLPRLRIPPDNTK